MSGTQSPEKMDLAYEDSGSERLVHVGEEIQISLPETPTTGYRWRPDVDSAALRQTHDSYEGDVAPRGAGGARVMRFVALRPGNVVLRLVKRRSWDEKGADDFIVQLRVASP